MRPATRATSRKRYLKTQRKAAPVWDVEGWDVEGWDVEGWDVEGWEA